MSAVPLARFLVDFGSEGDTGPGRNSGAGNRAGERSGGTEGALRIAEAVARGHKEGRAAAEAEFQTKLDAQREELEQRLASERLAWVEQESGVLAARMSSAMQDVEASIADCAARLLHPLLTRELQRQTVAELAAAVRSLVSRDANASVAICGPEDLVGALRERLAGTPANLTFSINSNPDVQVTLDQTIVQSRLAAWRARLEEALA